MIPVYPKELRNQLLQEEPSLVVWDLNGQRPRDFPFWKELASQIKHRHAPLWTVYLQEVVM